MNGPLVGQLFRQYGLTVVAATLFSLLVSFTLTPMLAAHWTRQQDICIGISVANRNHPDLENLIGFFVNVLPIRCRLDAEMDFDDLLNDREREFLRNVKRYRRPTPRQWKWVNDIAERLDIEVAA